VVFDGYTKVAQKCDSLAERVGGTGAKIRFYRKRRSGDEVGQEFPKSSRFVRTGHHGKMTQPPPAAATLFIFWKKGGVLQS